MPAIEVLASAERRRAEPEFGETANGTPIKIPAIMKTAIIEKLRKDGLDVHRCAPGSDGNCYYLVSVRRDHDYGDKDGRVFKAIRETPAGGLETGASLAFFVSGTAQATARLQGLMGDFDAFVVKSGLARLRGLLAGDLTDPPMVDVTLTTDDPEKEFVSPTEPNPLAEQRDLRLQILRVLTDLHNAGSKRVTKDELLDRLCTDVALVDRVLNILAKQKFADGALTNGMKLTSAGFLEAEKTIGPPPASPEPQPTPVPTETEPQPLKARLEDRVVLSGEIRPVSLEQFEPSREALEKLIEEWGGLYPAGDVPEDPGNKTELPISRETYDLVLALGGIHPGPTQGARPAARNPRLVQ